VAVLGCVGLFFGIGLAVAAAKFAVEPDPKVEEVLEVLAGAQ
jgi:electron transport complex protein RnfB